MSEANQVKGALCRTLIIQKSHAKNRSTKKRNIAIRNMKEMTTLVEPTISLRLVQFTFFISLSVAMKKSTTFGLLREYHARPAVTAQKMAAMLILIEGKPGDSKPFFTIQTSLVREV